MLFVTVSESKFSAADFNRKMTLGIESCLFEMLCKQQNSKTESKKQQQVQGVMIAAQLTESSDDFFFKLMINALMVSKFKDVRKRIIKLLKVDADDKLLVQRCFLGSVLDAEPEVRAAAYTRLRELGFLLSDVESQKATMTIIKEGLSDRTMMASPLTGKVTSLKEEFLSFLEPLIF
jgi:hypothetical protein